MSVIATLLPGSLHLERLRAAVRDRHELRESGDWTSLARICDREPVRVAVVDLFANGAPHLEGIRQLKQRLPRLTLVAYVAITTDQVHDLFDAARAGVDGLIVEGQDDSPRALLAIVERSEARSLAGLIRQALEGVDRLVADTVMVSVTHAHERLSPSSLARLIAQPRRALTLRLVEGGFPPPQRLLTWGRLIVAAHMLEDDHRSADRVAATLAFPSGSAFRNTCQRYLHATPTEIRARGGAAFVLNTMLLHVHARVSNAHEPHGRSSARSPALAL